MKKTIKITVDGTKREITFTNVTAFNPEDNERMNAVLVHDSTDEFCDGDGVVFDGTIPENEEDALAFLQNEYINTDFSVMDTVIESKKITLSEVKKQLLESVAEFEKESVNYYLHITEQGKIVSDVCNADETFVFSVPYERYGLQFEDISDEGCFEKDLIYSHEVDGNEIFEEVSKALADKANKWLEEL